MRYIKYDSDKCTVYTATRKGWTSECFRCEKKSEKKYSFRRSSKEGTEIEYSCGDSTTLPLSVPETSSFAHIMTNTAIDIPYKYNKLVPDFPIAYHGFITIKNMCGDSGEYANIVNNAYGKAYARISTDCINNIDTSTSIYEDIIGSMINNFDNRKADIYVELITEGIKAGMKDAYKSYYSSQWLQMYDEAFEYINVQLSLNSLTIDKIYDNVIELASNNYSTVIERAVKRNAASHAYIDITKEFYEYVDKELDLSSFTGDMRNISEVISTYHNGHLVTYDDYINDGTISEKGDIDWNAIKYFQDNNEIDTFSFGTVLQTPGAPGAAEMLLPMIEATINTLIIDIASEYRWRI
jgi:hemoglobin-like flavoprotein